MGTWTNFNLLENLLGIAQIINTEAPLVQLSVIL
jgi:hypothetical protein